MRSTLCRVILQNGSAQSSFGVLFISLFLSLLSLDEISRDIASVWDDFERLHRTPAASPNSRAHRP